jgi:hypothetical protein
MLTEAPGTGIDSASASIACRACGDSLPSTLTLTRPPLLPQAPATWPSAKTPFGWKESYVGVCRFRPGPTNRPVRSCPSSRRSMPVLPTGPEPGLHSSRGQRGDSRDRAFVGAVEPGE